MRCTAMVVDTLAHMAKAHQQYYSYPGFLHKLQVRFTYYYVCMMTSVSDKYSTVLLICLHTSSGTLVSYIHV